MLTRTHKVSAVLINGLFSKSMKNMQALQMKRSYFADESAFHKPTQEKREVKSSAHVHSISAGKLDIAINTSLTKSGDSECIHLQIKHEELPQLYINPNGTACINIFLFRPHDPSENKIILDPCPSPRLPVIAYNK